MPIRRMHADLVVAFQTRLSLGVHRTIAAAPSPTVRSGILRVISPDGNGASTRFSAGVSTAGGSGSRLEPGEPRGRARRSDRRTDPGKPAMSGPQAWCPHGSPESRRLPARSRTMRICDGRITIFSGPQPWGRIVWYVPDFEDQSVSAAAIRGATDEKLLV